MNISYLLYPTLPFFLLRCVIISGSVAFSSLDCHAVREDFGIIKECRTDPTKKLISVHFYLKKTLNAVKFKYLKRERANWRPYLYAMTVDICEFFQNKKKYFVPNMIYSFGEKFTNINHTCPYEAGTELVLEQWQLDETKLISKFFVDSGEYAIHTTWYGEGVMGLQINGSIKFRT